MVDETEPELTLSYYYYMINKFAHLLGGKKVISMYTWDETLKMVFKLDPRRILEYKLYINEESWKIAWYVPPDVGSISFLSVIFTWRYAAGKKGIKITLTVLIE